MDCFWANPIPNQLERSLINGLREWWSRGALTRWKSNPWGIILFQQGKANTIHNGGIPSESGPAGRNTQRRRKRREFGIPTVVDRVVQQAIAQVSSPFTRSSSHHTVTGSDPNATHIRHWKCKDYITAGYIYAVDMDLEKFFDTVNQSKLIEVLSQTIKDGRVISLIHKYLIAGVMKKQIWRNKRRSPARRPIESVVEQHYAQWTGLGNSKDGTPICTLCRWLGHPLQKQTECRTDIKNIIRLLRINCI